MTIDKAIAQEKELFEHCKRLYEPLSDEDKSINPLLKNEIEYHKQLAEWLEELKSYKEKPEGWMWDEAERKGYNKAIDDFVAEIKAIPDQDESLDNILWGYIAQQLKAGGVNDNG